MSDRYTIVVTRLDGAESARSYGLFRSFRRAVLAAARMTRHSIEANHPLLVEVARVRRARDFPDG